MTLVIFTLGSIGRLSTEMSTLSTSKHHRLESLLFLEIGQTKIFTIHKQIVDLQEQVCLRQ